ncbi:MAG: glycosyltransferase family 1 protein, partial [Candidatus Absconditabacteria bacterium]
LFRSRWAATAGSPAPGGSIHHVEDYWKDTGVGKMIFKKIDNFVTISEFTKNQLISNGVDDEKIFVNYNGIGEDFYPDKNSNFEYNNYILYVGSEAKRKNLETLIKAFKFCTEKHANLKLIKIGPSFFKEQETKNNELVKELNLDNNIVFIRDFVSYDKLRQFYSNAICYVSVSKLEGFGLTVPEALACDCPVVASKIPVFEEILGSSQILVNPNNPQEIANGIIKYIENKDFRKQMIIEGKNIADKFKWNKNVKNIIKFLNQQF